MPTPEWKKPKWTFDEYKQSVGDQKYVHPEWRLGQAAFNLLYRIHPTLADQVRSNYQLDPFYFDETLPAFYEYVKAHWDD